MTRRIAILFASLATGLCAGAGTAQTGAGEQFSALTDLGLPEQFTMFGNRDPNVRRPTAIVNGEIITQTDIDHRLGLFLASNPNAQIGDQEMMQLRMQILRNLIDETLQIQEAEANDIDITEAELNQTYTRVAGNFAPNVDDFDEFLRAQGSSERSIKRQIEGELAWDRLLRRNVSPFVNVSDAQVEEIVERLQATRGQTEYRVSEIFLAARPDNQEEVFARANQLVQQIQQAGGSFPAYARQFSEATTAAVGGDLGWVLPEQLPAELARVVPQMSVGSMSAPIPLPGGFSIIALADSRQILSADPRDAVLSLKQITVTFADGIERAEAEPRISNLAAAVQQGGGCGAAEDIAASVGGDVVQNDNVRVRDLPAELQQVMGQLQIGEATPPFGSLDQGVRVLILCGRDDPQQVASVDPTAIEDRLVDERINRQARSYLRDLRNNAVIEYR